MPVDPTEALELAQGVAEVLAQAEARLVEIVGSTLVEGIESPDWDVRALQRTQALRARLTAATKLMEQTADAEVQRAILDAWQAGADSASADLADLTTPAFQPRAIRDAAHLATESLVGQAKRTVGQLAVQAAFRSEQVYRDTARQVIAQATAGAGVARRDLAARFLAKLTDRGVTGFTDRAGRRWDMAAYGEMVTRTTTRQAMVAGHIDQLADYGQDLVMVSDAPQECKLCRPFEGRVLSATGRTPRGTYTEDGATYTVLTSVAAARAAGLFHPNCRHRLVAYQPGVTPPLLDTEDPEGDALRQEQRARERKVRKARRDLAATEQLYGPNSTATRAARAKLRTRQAELKQHITDNGLKNLAYRTRTDIGNVKVGPNRRGPLEGPSAPTGPTTTPNAPRTGPAGPASPAIPDEKLPTRRRGKRTPPADVKDRNSRELRDAGDDELDEALRDAIESDHPGLDRLMAEIDRREQAPFRAQARQEMRRQAAADRRAAEYQVKADRVAELIDQGADPREAVADVFGISVEAQQRTELLMQLRSEGTPGKTLDEMIRHTYKRETARLYVAAEDATRGQMLNKAGTRAGIDPASFFSGTTRTEARIRRYASDELLEWFDQNGQPTLAEWRAQLLTGTSRSGIRTDDFLT